MNEPNQINPAELKSDNLTCALENNFSSLIQSAIKLGSGYRQKSREISATHYAAAYQYNIDESNRETHEAELKKLCMENNIDVTPGKTSSYHMIVRLTFTEATKQYVSDKVHVLSVALAKQIKPENFLTWLEKERGERKIVETYKRDGSLKQEDTSDENLDANSGNLHRERNRNEQIQRARQQLSNSVAFKVDAATASQALPKLKIDMECAAIIVHQADGSVVIKAIVADHDTAEDVYAGYYRTNSHEIDSAVQHKKITEMLENSEDLTLSDIRKELGDEIANKAAEEIREANAFNKELMTIPQELHQYMKLLKKADCVTNTSGAISRAGYFEKALDELDQVLADEPLLLRYLDRPFNRNASLDPESVPRMINSKSQHSVSHSANITKQRILKEFLRHELELLRSGNHPTVSGTSVTG